MKRTAFDILLLIGLLLVLFVLPVNIERQGVQLFLFKGILVSAGMLHAHISRKLLFPYVDLKKLIHDENGPGILLITAWYVVFVLSWSRGG